ncbi:MAG: PLP-dependent aminotransferase family protein [Bryobacterales bacterium]|nr:PLP-dependent aminotransferase family protein [Acidobacteriota bacterium]MCB9385977.1 PLP-dependent aminotransferase family protein [Bryobacterales bacterium]
MDFEALLSADARVMRSSLIRQLTGLVNQPDVISFAAGSPSAQTYPYEQLTALYQELVAREQGRLFQYSVTRGAPELIEAVRERSQRVQGIEASAEQTILVSGSQQGLDFVGRVLLDPGDAVFVELPNFIGATSAFENFRARVFGVRHDDDGMDLEDLRRKIAEARAAGNRPKFIYVIPNFQNPSGATWSAERREGLLELAREEGVLIFEDDAYGELYFNGVNPASLRSIKSRDTGDQVLYMGTFSKILAAGLRVAWIHGPAAIVRRIELAKETGDLCSSTLSQKLVLGYLRHGWLDAHLDGVRDFYERKAQHMQTSLGSHFTSLARWNRPRGGLFLWVDLLEPIDALPLLHKAVEQEKVAFIPGQPFFVDGSGANSLRLSYSNVTDENIEIGLHKLSRLIAAAAG